jgi:hypothetical protein
VPAAQTQVPAVQQAVPAVQTQVPAAQPAFAVHSAQAATQPAGAVQHAAPTVQPPVHADAVAVDEELPEPVEEGAAAPAHKHQHHAHAARIDAHSPATGLYALVSSSSGRTVHPSRCRHACALEVCVGDATLHV